MLASWIVKTLISTDGMWRPKRFKPSTGHVPGSSLAGPAIRDGRRSKSIDADDYFRAMTTVIMVKMMMMIVVMQFKQILHHP